MSAIQSPESSAPARTKRHRKDSSTSKKDPSKALELRTPEEERAALDRYGRGESISVRSARDKKLRTNLKKIEHRYKDAALKAKDAELLLGEERGYLEAEGMEKTFKFKQADLRKAVDVATAQKGFELKLPTFGPYFMDYTRNGRYLLLGGTKGHVAAFDWREGKLSSEIQLKETVRDVKWLHNELFFAVAQKKYTYIYDSQGVEIHCLKNHIEVTNMEFLPYHFLLATIGNAGWLKYQDTSTGNLVSEHRTRLGSPTSMTQNTRNAIIHVGHGNGSVTLWSPNVSTPAVKMLTNRGPVRAIAIDRGGNYMATAGADSRMNIFDIRTFKEVHSYYTPTPASSLHISDTGLLSVGWGPHVTVWKDALKVKQTRPYLSHLQEASHISRVRFCPYDEILGVGHHTGFSNLIIPGAGEPNFDALEANPYETTKQRREREVSALLNKLQPEMISLDPDFIGRIDKTSKDVRDAEKEAAEKQRKLDERMNAEVKNKMRGKNSALRKYLRKKSGKNIIDERRLKLEALKKERALRNKGLPASAEEELGPALARFGKRPGKVV
ncbi:BING4CT-domain-containing protein [Choiromyces venosus 120613-1]|uniref:U three protein 7 n=1 Tax=Choiromyces venosus 120613-1 TaxID=1336337 RepID=A0A3N4JMW3_9PEZI|nr:BING4CT-domain-containing protein [Choiromyces venosus 120613-1]